MISNKIIIFCYSFITGVAIAIGLFPNFDVFIPLFPFSDLLVLHWLLILAGFLILLWILLGRIPLARSIFIVLVPLLLGVTNYWRFFNTKFPQHITNYFDDLAWDYDTKIRGTVVREPDVRPGKTNLTVKPFEIKKFIYPGFSEGEFTWKMPVKRLIKAINTEFKVRIKNTGTEEELLKALNEFLENPKFYDTWQNKKDKKIIAETTEDKEIKKLLDKTADTRNKIFSELTVKEKETIKRLNRLLLEKIYPHECPKSKKLRRFQREKKVWTDWKKLEGKTGNVLVQVKPVIGDYYETCDYGDIIEVHYALRVPMQKQNPGSFDYEEYLKSMWGIYACMYPKPNWRVPEPIKKLVCEFLVYEFSTEGELTVRKLCKAINTDFGTEFKSIEEINENFLTDEDNVDKLLRIAKDKNIKLTPGIKQLVSDMEKLESDELISDMEKLESDERKKNLIRLLLELNYPQNCPKNQKRAGWLLKFALDLKKRMICTVKKTIPFPQSAFLGGVTLGTRGGVPPQMKFEFQATGVAHVLSVSGLHAGFIALLFFMLCSLFKISPKPRWLIVSLGLLIFTLITGARPATMRSSIMYSMLLFFNTFGLGLKASAALTIPVSGCIILFFNPLLAPSASFVLSYIAVWSLVYLSGPVRDFFEAYVKSWFFIVFFFWAFFFTALVCVNPLLYKNSSFLLFIAATVVLTILAAGYLDKIRPIENLSMSMIPPSLQGLVGFFYAQFAIQIGMMIPLSAVYFHRFPAAGIYANFIAIPLIGFIVMVGFLAGLLEAFFSVIGLGAIGASAALVLNAGNYWLTKLFTGVAHFFFKAFPYPFMPTLHLKAIVIYYAAVLIMAFYKPILDIFETLKQRLKYLSREELTLRISVFGIAAVLLAVLYSVKFGKEETGKFRFTVMAIGFGNCNLIRTPMGKNILVDTTRAGMGPFNFQNLAAAFTFYNISSFENFVLTNLKPENTGNAVQILPYFPAKKITTSYDPYELSKKMPYQEFLSFLDDDELKVKWDLSYTQMLYANWYFLIKAPLIPYKDYKRHTGLKKIFSAKKGFPLYRTKRGDVLYSERAGEKDFIIRVLWPEKRRMAGTGDDLANNSIVLKITYGNFSMLVPSDVKYDAQDEMVTSFPDKLKSDVLIAPYHGDETASNKLWYRAVAPSLVIIPYLYDKGWSLETDDLAKATRLSSELGARVLRLDKLGAVTITSDGEKFEWESIKEAKDEAVGEASFEDSLDVF